MSKTRCITFETSDNFDCTLRNIAMLLKSADWSFIDINGNVNIYDINGDDEWGRFCGTYQQFLNADFGNRLVEIYHSDGQTAELCINNEHSFKVFLSSYIKMIGNGVEQHVDLNWYYENMVNNFNKTCCVIERVMFEEIF